MSHLKLVTTNMRLLLVVLVGTLAGCASMPDATVRYRLPKASSTITVIESYACNKDQTDHVVVATPTITTSYSADTDEGSMAPQVNLKDLENWYTSSTASFSLTEDGRLRSFNGSSSGTGGEIVKSAVATVTPLDAGLLKATKKKKKICEVIDRLGDPKTKTITITRTATFDHKTGFAAAPGGQPAQVVFKPDPTTEYLFLAVSALGTDKDPMPPAANLFTVLELPFGKSESQKGGLAAPRVHLGTSWKESGCHQAIAGPALVLNRVRKDTLAVTSRKHAGAGPIVLKTFEPIVPDTCTYQVPIAKPAFFGDSQSILSLADSGELTAITYGAKSGTAAAFDALGQVHSLVNPPAAQQAAELQARADLIAQHGRLAACEANAANCAP